MAEGILFTISSLLLITALVFGAFLKQRRTALYLFAGALAIKVIKEFFIKEDWIFAALTLVFMCFMLFLARKEKLKP